MTKQTKLPNIAIISAELSTLPSEINSQRTKALKGMLEAYKIPHKEMLGVYKGTKESSFVVVVSHWTTEAVLELVAKEFGQECYLFSNQERDAWLVYTNEGFRHEKLQGKLRAVSPTFALKQDAYTQSVDGDEFFVVC